MSQNQHVAIIDIGSNAVRLVVYNELNRVPIKVHTERDICGLGKGLLETGHLNPQGVKHAIDSLTRFSGILKAMKIKNVRAVATAAMRDATDGLRFMKRVKDKVGIQIEVITGDDEAYYSALGVIASHGQVTGVVGDFGGGSLELAAVKKGKIIEHVTLPLGALRILSKESRKERLDYIESHLKTTDLLKRYHGQNFYILGGAWRTLAKAHMYLEKYPIFILDHYKISGRKAEEWADKLSRRSEKSLEKTAGIIKRRASDMPAGALVLGRVLHALKPKELVFTATGLREGLLYEQLSPALKRQDPLMASCVDIAQKTSRFSHGAELKALGKWMKPLFPEADEQLNRVVEAASYLSDFGWYEHEDYRAPHAFQRILRLPLYGLDHTTRAMLALSAYVRYRGYLRQSKRDEGYITEVTRDAQDILTQKQIDQAVTVGLLLQLAYSLTAGALGLLKHTELKLTDRYVRLTLKTNTETLRGEIIQSQLEIIAKRLKRKAAISKSTTT